MEILQGLRLLPQIVYKLFNEPLRSEIALNLKSFGFEFITVDLLGYRTGSFNEQIPQLDEIKVDFIIQ